MSRLAIAVILSLFPALAAAEPPSATDTAMERYLAFASVNPNCRQLVPGDMIVVCGKRNADRYRVPLVIPTRGDPKVETVMGEKVRLQHQTSTCDEKKPFQVECGMVGVSATIGLGGGGVRYRELAP